MTGKTWRIGGWKAIGVAALAAAAFLGGAAGIEAAAPAAVLRPWCAFGPPVSGGWVGGSVRTGRVGEGPGVLPWPGTMGLYGGFGSSASFRPVARPTCLGDALPSGATVDRGADRVAFGGRQVRLVVVASPAGQPDETSRIAGLVNPTLVVPVGATVHLTLITADADMPHDLVVTRPRRPSPSWP